MDAFIGTILLWPVAWAPQDWLFCNGQMLQTTSYQALFSLIGNRFGGDGRTTFALPDLRGRVPVGVGQQPGGSLYNLGQYGGKEQNQAFFSGGTSITVPLVQHNHTATASVSFNPVTPTASASLSGVQVQIPASASGTADTAVPGPTATLAKPKLSSAGPGASATIYTSAAPDTTLKPGGSVTGSVSVTVNPITITPASATVTVANAGTGNTNPIPVNISGTANVSAMQPYQVLNYIICVNGLYPTRPD